MKRLLVASLGIAVLAWASQASAAPKALTDGDLDGVVAGSAIIGNDASASISESGAVELSGSALSDSQALNISNTAESLAANGVNFLGYAGDFQQNNTMEQYANAEAAYISHGDLYSERANSLSDVTHSSAGVDPAALNIAINGVDFSYGYDEPSLLSTDGGQQYSFSLDSASLDANYGRGAAAAGNGTDNTIYAEVYDVGYATADRGAACVTAAGASCSAAMNNSFEAAESCSSSETTSELDYAVATYITGDSSDLEVSREDDVTLGCDSFQGASALNVTNASSSLALNGVNIALGTISVNGGGVTAQTISAPSQYNNLYQTR